MADVSNDTDKQIPYQAFLDMETRVDNFISTYGRNPLIVYVDSLRIDYVSWTKWEDMHTRFWNWYTANGNTYPTFVWVVYPGTDTGGGTTNPPTTPDIPSHLPKTTIYVGSPITSVTSVPQLYTGESVPYYNCTLKFTLFQAAVAEFESPNWYEDGSTIRIIGEHKQFGGFITGRKETPNGYAYTCIDYSMRLFGQYRFIYHDAYISDIIKNMLIQIGLPTNGIQQSTLIHPEIIITDETRWNICHQLANMDGMEFLVNQDGIPILRTKTASTEGYVFQPEDMATDYGMEYSASDIITNVRVYGKDDVYLYKYADAKLKLKYGYLGEFITDSNITTTAEAERIAQELMKEKAKVQFVGTMVIPAIIDITEAEWAVLVSPSWNPTPTRAYYINEVKISINESGESTELQFLDAKPKPPSEWIYTDPDSGCDVVSTSTPTGPSDVPYTGGATCDLRLSSSVAGKAYMINGCAGNYDYDTVKHDWGPWLNWCPHCGAIGTLSVHADQPGIIGIKCDDCDVDHSAFHGYGTSVYIGGVEYGNASGGTPACKNQLIGCGDNPFNNITGNAENCVTPVEDEFGLTEYVPSNINTPALIREWVDNNIMYEFYYDHNYTIQQVLQYKRGNCYDQSALVVALLTIYGYEASIVHVNVTGGCGGYVGGHYNVRVKINGVYKTIDTTCHGFNQI